MAHSTKTLLTVLQYLRRQGHKSIYLTALAIAYEHFSVYTGAPLRRTNPYRDALIGIENDLRALGLARLDGGKVPLTAFEPAPVPLHLDLPTAWLLRRTLDLIEE